LLLYAAPIWVFICLLHVVIQDRLLFPRMFAQYPDYKRETPMLIPNKSSIAACLRTLKARGT
jgi:protein-S-isoprenylcysteine O-methyltransferase Ste14